MQKPDSPFAPPGRRRTKLRGLSLRAATPFDDGFSASLSRGFSSVFCGLNLLFPRLANLFVLVSAAGVVTSPSAVSGAAVALVRRRNGRRSLAACWRNIG